MTLSWRPALSALLVPALCLTLQASVASASGACAAADATSRWVPQRTWPLACEPDAVTDGLVLLEGEALPPSTTGGTGELRVVVQRLVAGSPVETFPGKVSFPDATSALFQTERPLPPQADYQVAAVRVAADGTELGAKFISTFSTGVRTLAPLALSDAPTLRYEEAETERYDCVTDSCGAKKCQASDQLVHVKSVRVAVPAILGGVDLKPLTVSAQLVASFSNGQAPAVATSDTAATQAGKRSFIVIELPALPASAQGCVTISAVDAAGHTLKTEPVCLALQADDAPYDLEDQGIAVVSELGLSQSTDSLTASDQIEASQQIGTAQAAAAQGCAIGQGNASLGSARWGIVGWLALALALARLRSGRAPAQRAMTGRAGSASTSNPSAWAVDPRR